MSKSYDNLLKELEIVSNEDNSIVYNKIHDFTNENIKNIIEQFR